MNGMTTSKMREKVPEGGYGYCKPRSLRYWPRCRADRRAFVVSVVSVCGQVSTVCRAYFEQSRYITLLCLVLWCSLLFVPGIPTCQLCSCLCVAARTLSSPFGSSQHIEHARSTRPYVTLSGWSSVDVGLMTPRLFDGPCLYNEYRQSFSS